MSKFIVIVFLTEAQAYQGPRVLQELHAEGSLTLYSMAELAKDSTGTVSIKEAADAGPLGTAVEALVGGLIGVIGGPVGAAAGATGGTLLGSLGDLFNYGVSEDFLLKVSKELAPERSAVIAEVSEGWMTPLDTRKEALGGAVLRTWRADSKTSKSERRLRIDGVSSPSSQFDREPRAKMATLEKQLTKARDQARENVSQQIRVLRADYEKRSAKLKQAWHLSREAFAA